MKKRNSESPTERRNFLKGAVASGVAAMSALSASKLLADEGKPPEREQDTLQSRGYHETDHIRAYYRTLKT